ncbi:MAG: tol-pal system protein YbgF [Myxococcota bacterium]
MSVLQRSHFALGWVATLLASCVTTPQFYALEREVAALKAERAGPGGATDDRVAELGAQVDALHDEMARLRGDIEEARYLAEQALKEVRSAEEGAAPGPVTSPPAGATPLPLDPQNVSSEVKAYEEAFATYRSGEYEAAIDRFRHFLQTYPSSEHSDNALFWTGECYFKLGDYERAVLTFEDVVKRFPEGNKVPDALYRQGIALLEIAKQSQDRESYRQAARDIFERIVREHSSSERVAEAQRQLEKLSR